MKTYPEKLAKRVHWHVRGVIQVILYIYTVCYMIMQQH